MLLHRRMAEEAKAMMIAGLAAMTGLMVITVIFDLNAAAAFIEHRTLHFRSQLLAGEPLPP